MRHESFAAFILTHGRADRVYTYETLRKSGYTGRIVIVIDNEDKAGEEYKERFGGEVYVFDKSEADKYTDVGDNRGDARGVVFARNACWNIARDLGLEYFIQLDDDYVDFRHKLDGAGNYIDKKDILDLDAVFDVMLDYLMKTPALSIAMAQGGDFIGGKHGKFERPKRKAMNSFVCATSRPFQFYGRLNEDLTATAVLAPRGGLFLTIPHVALQQKQTQKNPGGLTEMYLDSGTYVKSFYSVMYQPSSVQISVLQSKHSRIHHKVHWRYTAPYIVAEAARKV
jgi:hypothetical protein